MEYYSALKRNKILQYATTGKNLVDIIPNETSQSKKYKYWGFPGGAVVENLPANAGDTGSSPGLGRSHMPQSN